jgi:hypothetical protein
VCAGSGCGSEACGVWDIGSGTCHSSYQTIDRHRPEIDPQPLVDSDVFVSGGVSFWKNTNAYSHLTEDLDGSPGGYPHHTRAILHQPDAPYLMTAGTDRSVFSITFQTNKNKQTFYFVFLCMFI